MAIDNPSGFSADRYIGKDTNNETGPNGHTIDCRNDRLVAVDDVIDEVFRLPPRCHARYRIIQYVLYQFEIASSGERLAGARHNHCINFGIIVDIAPNIGELRVGFRIHGVEGFRSIEGHPQYPLCRVVDFKSGIRCVTIGHGDHPGHLPCVCRFCCDALVITLK